MARFSANIRGRRRFREVEATAGEDAHLHYHGVDRAQEHVSVRSALDIFLKRISPVATEIVGFQKSLDRVLSEDVRARFDVPLRDRAARDGYALNINAPVPPGSEFEIVGEVQIGVKPGVSIDEAKEAIRVATGSFLPAGSNAVVMKEYAAVEGTSLMVTREVRAGENMVRRGEDIEGRSIVLLRGTRIMPHHIALLAMVGSSRVKVFRRPRVAFLSTGDELSDAAGPTRGMKIIDVNRPFMESMVGQLGAVPVDLGIARDDYDAIRRKIIRGLTFDVLILSAGSSVGERDYAAKAAESVRGLEILAHGVAMRPSSPTGLAIYRGRPFVMLPGFPTSMIVSFLVFCRPAILRRGGSTKTSLPMVKASLLGGYQGRAGLTQFLRLSVSEKDGSYFARVVRPTEAQYSSWLKDANGIGVLDPTVGEVKDGDSISVFLIGDLKRE